MYECPKCEGVGNIAHFAHIQEGVCYTCWGAGTVEFDPSAKLPADYDSDNEIQQGEAHRIQYVEIVRDPELRRYRIMVRNYGDVLFIHEAVMGLMPAHRLYNRILDADYINPKHWDSIPAWAAHYYDPVL